MSNITNSPLFAHSFTNLGRSGFKDRLGGCAWLVVLCWLPQSTQSTTHPPTHPPTQPPTHPPTHVRTMNYTRPPPHLSTTAPAVNPSSVGFAE
jgi:hypothetical protein